MNNTLKSCRVTIENIDLTELKKQKEVLIELIELSKNTHFNIVLPGLLSLIDAIQDKAVKDNGFNENDIYSFID